MHQTMKELSEKQWAKCYVEGSRKTLSYEEVLWQALTPATQDGGKEAMASFAPLDLTTEISSKTDNGGVPRLGASNYPLRGQKSGMFEGGVRSIGFVSGPLVPSQVTNNELIHISDWYPTLVNLAGGDLGTSLDLDGFDVWNSIVSDESSPRKELLYNINPEAILVGENRYPDIFDVRVQSAIRVGDYKLLTGFVGKTDHSQKPSDPDADPCPSSRSHRQKRQPPRQNVYLYNIKEDPSECDDLARKQPNKVIELLERLQFYNSTAVPVVVAPDDKNHNADKTGGAWVPWVE